MISYEAPGPSALETPTAPERNLLYQFIFKRTVHPGATRPMRRANIPIRMVVKRYNRKWLFELANVNRAQMMEIARARQSEWTEKSAEFVFELLDDFF